MSDFPPYALPLDEFLKASDKAPAALLGTAEDVVIPAAGLTIVAGRPGTGKTTLAIDGAFHLASGVEWLGQPVERPLRILIVENEGPREPFRRKLEAKHRAWPHPLTGSIYVHTLRWGAANFVKTEEATELGMFLTAERIDLVIGDPLSGLGVEGVGSPENVRRFRDALCELGLYRDVAFWFLHHFRHGATRNGNGAAANEIDELSGAWGGSPDTLLVVKELDGDRVRLSFPKVRWAAREFKPLILARRREDASFEVVAEEGKDGGRDVEQEVLVLLASDGEWRTLSEIARPKDNGGIGRNRDAVRQVLEELAAAGELEYAVGPDGRQGDAKCFRVAQPSEQPRATPLPGQGDGVGCSAPLHPRKGVGLGATPHPHEQPTLAQGVEQTEGELA